MLATAEQEEPVIFPWDAVGKVTAYDYLRKSRYFLEHAQFLDPKKMHHKSGPAFAIKEEREEIKRGMRVFVNAATKDPKGAKVQVLRFIEAEKQRIARGEVKAENLRGALKPIKLALDLNEVVLPWKNLMRLIGDSPRSSDREYTLEEVRQVLGAISLHLRVAVLFMASAGMRVGAFAYLNVGDIEPLEMDGKMVCGKVKVYAGEGDDEYETLISKEAYETFREYVKSRVDSGEKVTKKSPAVVIKRNLVDQDGNPIYRRCNPGTVRNSLTRVLWNLGMRKHEEGDEIKQPRKNKRYDVQVDHGLRKFFDNVAKDYMDEAYVEKLIGHDTRTKEHYDRHIPKPAIEQYLKAMPYLSISPAYRSEAELNERVKKQDEDEDKRYTQLRLDLLEKSQRLAELEKKRDDYDDIMRTQEALITALQDKGVVDFLAKGAKLNPALLRLKKENISADDG